MFSDIYRNSTEKNREICQRAISELSKTENRIEKLLLVRFYCCFCLARSSRNGSLFLGLIALSQFILKIMS